MGSVSGNARRPARPARAATVWPRLRAGDPGHLGEEVPEIYRPAAPTPARLPLRWLSLLFLLLFPLFSFFNRSTRLETSNLALQTFVRPSELVSFSPRLARAPVALIGQSAGARTCRALLSRILIGNENGPEVSPGRHLGRERTPRGSPLPGLLGSGRSGLRGTWTRGS